MPKNLLKDITYNQIKELIISGKLPMGTKCSETVLVEMLNAKKAPVRTALSMLNSEGLVQIKPKSGTYVFSVDDKELNELLSFRCSIEKSGILIAIKNNKDQLITVLKDIYNQMTVAIAENKIQNYLSLDNNFHDAIVGSSNNKYFIDAYKLVSSKMATIRNYLGTNKEHTNRSHLQHEIMIKLIENEDIELLLQIIEKHILPEAGSY